MEIIRHMEAIYADLADSQAELERRTRQLSEAKELADNILRSMTDGLITTDATGKMSLVNEAACRLFGFKREELVGRPVEMLLSEPARRQWSWPAVSRQVRRHGSLREIELAWRHREGTPIPVGVTVSAMRDNRGELMGAVFVVRDLREAKRRTAELRAKARELERANAELRQLQAELIQAAKMSSLGRLAAGVAHELNNPLGGIMLYSDLLLESMPPDAPERRNVEKIAQQTARCRRIVQDLLDFARPAKATCRPVDVNAVLRATLNIVEGQELFHNIKVRWDLAEGLPVLLGDRDQLRQAFLNVVLNAVEAMDGTGTLSISTRPGERPGTVQVTISDTGKGIPEEHLDKLFEPFFTTKEGGTGLGLPITYGIVERHGGSMRVESQPGKGTSFHICLASVRE